MAIVLFFHYMFRPICGHHHVTVNKAQHTIFLEVFYSVIFILFYFLLALQPPLGVVFYSPLVGFSLLAYEVS